MANQTEFYRIHDKKTGHLIAAMKYNTRTERVHIPPHGSQADYLGGCTMYVVGNECYSKNWKVVKVEDWE